MYRKKELCAACNDIHPGKCGYKMVEVTRCEGCGNPLLPREIPKHVCEPARDAVYYATHRHNAWMLP